jgi:hypothetical protein
MKLWVLFFVLVSSSVFASGFVMPQDEFLKASELVAVVQVNKIASWTKDATTGVLLFDVELKVQEVLKGDSTIKNITIKSYSGITGTPEMEMGKRYVMFLEWSQDLKVFLPVNGLQGCWGILKNNQLTGMGHGKTLESLRKELQ